MSLGTRLPMCCVLGLILSFFRLCEEDGLRLDTGVLIFVGNFVEIVILVGVGFNDLVRRGGALV